MNRESLTAVWSKVPVANRLVEVNTKTGFSLTAGSYSVRASSTQYGSISEAVTTTEVFTCSSVTVTRAVLQHLGSSHTKPGTPASSGVSGDWNNWRITLTDATTVTFTRTATASDNDGAGVTSTGD